MTTTPNDSYGSSGYGEGDPTSVPPPDYPSAPDYSAGFTDTPSYDSASTTEAAKGEARHVKDTTARATQQVAGTAKQQTEQVAGDVKEQAQLLASQTKSELSDQAASQRDRAADGLHSLSGEFRTMADSSDQAGLGAQLARQGADLTEQAAQFLAQRDPGQLLDEIRDFARRRPGGFLVGAALAGVVVGRLSRGAMSARGSNGASQPAPILNEPYGEQQPPAGYDPGYAGRP